MDPYEVLGIRSTASLEEAEAAYHGLLRVHHPDLHHGGSDEQRAAAEARTRALNAAIGRIRAEAGRTEPEPQPHGPSWTRGADAGTGTQTAGDRATTRTHARPRTGWVYDTGDQADARSAGATGWIWDSPASPGAAGREPGGWDTGPRGPVGTGRSRSAWDDDSPWAGAPTGGPSNGSWTSAPRDFTDRAGGAGGQYFGDPLAAVPCPICGIGFQRSSVLKVHALEEHGIVLEARPKKRGRRRRRRGSFFGAGAGMSIWLFIPLNALVAVLAATVTMRLQPAITYWVFAVAMAPTAVRVISRDDDRL